MRIIQLARQAERRLALVDGGTLYLLEGYRSIHSLATAALDSGIHLPELVGRSITAERLDYDAIYQGLSEWRILPAADHPDEPARCLVSGTGLTHVKSAQTRQAMHAAGEELTDRSGIRCAWKGDRHGSWSRSHGEAGAAGLQGHEPPQENRQ